jgi:pimeloyl-ACP methyl ester carboxylesterase
MATFLLVHGAWIGGWCYRRVEKLLRSEGHDVYTPTNTGIGERVHLYDPSINLDTHVEDIMNVIKWENLDDFVLVGHSYGGMIITAIADRIPEKISTLVYLDAFVPEDGKCQFDYLPERVEGMRKDAKAHNNGVSPIPAEVFMVNENDVALVNRKAVRHPIHTFEQPVRLRGGLSRLRNKRVFISAAAYMGAFRQFYDILKDDPNWRIFTIDCGHMVMLDKPAELAKILLELI